MTDTLRQVGAGIRALLVLTVVLGLAYPLSMTAAAQVLFPDRAGGSLVESGGTVVGSSLIGQRYGADAPDPAYFQGRPSAAGDGYDPLSSSASNYGPENPEYVDLVRQRRADVAAFEGVDPARVPADAVQASGSGLDPDISPAYAALQVPRVARERGLDESVVRDLVAQHTEGRSLGFLGAPGVNVLTLNIALDAVAQAATVAEGGD